MRILYLTNGFPFPLTSGYLRHYFLIRELAQHHEIDLFSIVGSQFRASDREAMLPFTKHVETFLAANKRGSLAKKALNRVRSLWKPEAAVQQMAAALQKITSRERFDAVLLSGKRTYPAIEGLGLPLVIDMCDATSMKVRGSMRQAGLRRLPILMLDYLQVRRAERLMMQQAQHLLFATLRDREVLIGDSARATVIPNGVDTQYWQRSTAQRGAQQVVFTGAMDYPPNADAAQHLINDVMPLVWRDHPQAKALIVGRDPLPRLKAQASNLVEVTGFVDDMRPYLDQATVFAAPLRFGAGIQNKLLEALAMELPVVATPLASDGLRTERGQIPPISVGKDAAQLARLISSKLSEQQDNAEPYHQGRAFVEQHYVWQSSAQKLEHVIEQVSGN